MDSKEISEAGSRFSWLRVTLTLVPLLAALAVVTGYMMLSDHWEAQASLETEGLARFGLGEPTVNRLAERYRDDDGDLLADSPANESQQIDPERLSFSYIVVEEAEAQAAWWRVFLDHIAEVTGRDVEYLILKDTNDQLQALRDGKLQIAGLNTGAVPRAVNACGFVPLATLGREDSSFGYKMQIIVPADSPVMRLEDLRGRQLTFTARNSHSGFKAPLVLLKDDFGLLPDRDYTWGFSHAHEESIARVAAGDIDAAAVASDMVARAIASKSIEAAQIRTIHESSRFPPAALGIAHNLNPELASKIRRAILEFQIADTSLQKQFTGTEVSRFVPVDYRRDWAIIRRADDALGTVHEVE